MDTWCILGLISLFILCPLFPPFWGGSPHHRLGLWEASRERRPRALPAALRAKAHHDTILHRGLVWASGPRTQLSQFQIFFYEHDKLLNISEPRLKQKLFALQSCFESQVRYPTAWHIVGVQWMLVSFLWVLCWSQGNDFILGEERLLFIMQVEQWQQESLGNTGFPCPGIGNRTSACLCSQALSIRPGRPGRLRQMTRAAGPLQVPSCSVCPFFHSFTPSTDTPRSWVPSVCRHGVRCWDWQWTGRGGRCPHRAYGVRGWGGGRDRCTLQQGIRAVNKECGLWEGRAGGSTLVWGKGRLPWESDVETET